jgi:hypothetical protein
MTWEVLGWVLALISLVFGVYKHIQSEKKERLNEKLGAIRDNFDKDITSVKDVFEAYLKDVIKEAAQVVANYTLLEKRVRVVESRQITEQRVQSMLVERISPVESAVEKLEDKIERNHRELSTEFQIAIRELSASVAKLLENVSYMSGTMEARRKDDNIN